MFVLQWGLVQILLWHLLTQSISVASSAPPRTPGKYNMAKNPKLKLDRRYSNKLWKLWGDLWSLCCAKKGTKKEEQSEQEPINPGMAAKKTPFFLLLFLLVFLSWHIDQHIKKNNKIFKILKKKNQVI